MDIRRLIKENRLEIFLVVGLVLLSLLPRVIDLGMFLTADEKNWIGRSYEFIRAFKDWRFNDMLQTTHPGVTTLWLAGVFVSARMVVGHIPFNFNNLVHFIEYAQWPIAVVNALFVPLVYWLLRRLLKDRVWPLLGATFIALNPIIIGYSRLVHVDALLMNFMLVASLSLLLYAKNNFTWKWLVVSAVAGGLAFLTKAPAVFLIPYFGLVVIIFCPKVFVRKELFIDRSRELLLWLIIVGLLFVILWPAILWVENPEGNVLLLKRDIGRAVVTPHHMAESYKVDVSYYFYTLLSRTSPLVQVATVVFVVWLVGVTVNKDRKASWEVNEKEDLRVVWLLLLYVFFFLVMMTLGAKKGDRYILPVFPVLDILAAGGVLLVADLVGGWLRRWPDRPVSRKLGSLVVVGVVVLGLAYTVNIYHPYAIAYSNPVWPDNLSQELGWGEGLEQVGEWLNKNAPQAVVASWYPEELAAFTTAQVAHINAHEQGKVGYIVLYKNMFGRAPDHPANDFIDEYYKKREPVFVAEAVGKEFAWVYEKPVYERVVGELESGERVGQEIEFLDEGFAGVDVMVATYSGRAKSGELVVSIKDKEGGKVIYKWEKKVEEIEDDLWLRLLLPQGYEEESGSVFVEMEARGTLVGDAPTVRYTRDFDYRDSDMVVWRKNNGYSRKVIDGDLAIRLLYKLGDQLVTEEDTKLLGGYEFH
jgi:4-amino-4-deoxy-L-arabinose transferase-like glycosyltransferase